MRSADRKVLTTGQQVYVVDGWGKDAVLRRLRITRLDSPVYGDVVFFERPHHGIYWVMAGCTYIARGAALKHLRNIQKRKDTP